MQTLFFFVELFTLRSCYSARKLNRTEPQAVDTTSRKRKTDEERGPYIMFHCKMEDTFEAKK
jgi:hypothetical protein